MIDLGDTMKIVISPSKTMRSVPVDNQKKCLFHQEKELLLKRLKKYSIRELEDLYHSSTKIAEESFQRFQRFKEDSLALSSYTGAQFKALDSDTLSVSSWQFLEENLFIISGLYGLLRPIDTIGLYRLPMNSVLDKPLKDYWKIPISEVLRDQTIINLASQEYSEVIDESIPMITIDFYHQSPNGKRKKPSMEVKKQRGKYLRYLALKESLSLETLTSYCDDGYTYDQHSSNSDKIIYIKKL